jgi:hypothetical protein
MYKAFVESSRWREERGWRTPAGTAILAPPQQCQAGQRLQDVARQVLALQ